MKKVLLLLIDGFETYEASVFIDVIGWNLIDGNKNTQLFTCGKEKIVKTTFEQKMVVDYIIDEIDVNDFDALAVPGGFEEYGYYNNAYDQKIQNLIIDFHNQNKIIATICVASIVVAKTGILKNKEATTYNMKAIRQEELENYGAIVTHKPIVITENIITCWNPCTAIDVAFILLEQLTDKTNTDFIKKIMGFYV